MLAFLMQRAAGQFSTGHPALERKPEALPDLNPLRELLDAQPEKRWLLRTLARLSGYSPFHLIRLFHAVFHETPHAYVLKRRLDKARRLLARSSLSVTEICFAVGFESLGSFSSLFRQKVGYSPTVYRARVARQGSRPFEYIPSCHAFRYKLRVSPQFSRSQDELLLP